MSGCFAICFSSMAVMSRLDFPSAATLKAAAAAVAITAGLLLAWETGKMWYDRQHRPRGPTPLPVFGNLLSLGTTKLSMLTYVRGLRQKYGDVFTLFFGSVPVVLLNGYDAIYEGLVRNGDKCQTRYPLTLLLSFAGETDGIILSPHWKEQRKFSLETLREHGMGKVSLEEKIHEELGYLFEILDAHGGNTCSIHTTTRRAIANIICNITFGSRFDYQDATYTSLIGGIVRLMTILPMADVSIVFPFLRHFPGKWKEVEALKGPILSQLRKLIDEKEALLDENNPSSYIDSMLVAARQKGANADSSGFSKTDLVANVFLLFTGGTDTTDSTIRWALLHLLVRPDVQDKLYQEIADKIGFDRLPSVRDRQHMPYTEAFIAEVLRMTNPAFFTLSYVVSQPMVVAGKAIPAGAVLLGNLDSVSQDHQLFHEPAFFKPERHLNSTGNYVKPDKLIPFSLGRRSCIGESLARMEIFVFLTSIVQRYRLLPPLDHDGKVVPLAVQALDQNAVLAPYLYECRLLRRC